MTLIGIMGKAGSGKDTAADVLIKDFGFVRVSLADPLKRICQDVFEFSDQQLWGPSQFRNAEDRRYPRENAGVRMARNIAADLATDNTPVPLAVQQWSAKDIREYLTPRYALQQLGTEWGRECYPNVWIDYALRVYDKLQTGQYYYDTKTGLRPFLGNDWAAGKTNVVIPDVRFKNEADAIQKRGGFILKIARHDAGLSGEAGKHISETEQDEIVPNLILHNESTLEDFLRQVESIGSQLLAQLKVADTIPAPLTEALATVDHELVQLEQELDVELGLQPSVTLSDGTQVFPDQPRSRDRLSQLLEERQRDVDAGKIQDCDLSQVDVPPFKRRR